MNKTTNGPITRLIRTIGYVLIGVASLLLLVNKGATLNYDWLNNIIAPINKFIENTLPLFVQNSFYLIFIVGLLILLYTQTKSWFIKIFVTIVGVFTVLALNQTAEGILPFKTGNIAFINQVLAVNIWMEMILLVLVLFPLYLILAYRKPHAKSATFVSSGLLLLLIAIVLEILAVNIPKGLFVMAVYPTIVAWVFMISYLTLILGGIIGLFAIFNK